MGDGGGGKMVAGGSGGRCRTRALDFQVSYKVLLLGDSGVGKTSMIQCLRSDKFTTSLLPTVGVDFVNKVFGVDGALVRLQVWDTAGQERFRTITRFQYRGSKGLLLVYDVTDRTSFDQLTYWFKTLEDKDLDAEQIVLIGNKTDLENRRTVTGDMARAFANSHGIRYFETSCKRNENVINVFQQLAFDILDANNPKLMGAYNKTLKELVMENECAAALEKNNNHLATTAYHRNESITLTPETFRKKRALSNSNCSNCNV